MNDARGMQMQMPVRPASCVVGGEADAEDGAGWGSVRRAGEKRGMKMAPGRDKDGLGVVTVCAACRGLEVYPFRPL